MSGSKRKPEQAKKMAMLTFYWIPELLSSFVFCEKSNVRNHTEPSWARRPPSWGRKQSAEERWQLGSTREGQRLPQFPRMSGGVRGGGSREKKERKKWTLVVRVHGSISCIMTVASSKLRSPQQGVWHLLLVKTMHRVWGFVILCLLFFSNSRAKMSLLGYCISNLLHLSLHLSG